MGIAYAVVAWVLLQVVDLVLDNIVAPEWIMKVFMLAVAVGFPLAVIIAWAFEMTPEGLKRESEVDRSQSITPQTGHKLDRIIIVVPGGCGGRASGRDDCMSAMKVCRQYRQRRILKGHRPMPPHSPWARYPAPGATPSPCCRSST